MNKKIVYSIGLMSGTSLDGLDIVYVKFFNDINLSFEIIHSETISYTKEWRGKLSFLMVVEKSEIDFLDREYGVFLGNQVKSFIDKYEISKIDFIASHGHTVFHQPEKGITKQIGKGQRIADITKHKVVCDFRTQDVLLGGQGAPLVPVGDRLLFSDFDACINLGGFANISFENSDSRFAFDICPANVVLNHFSRKIGFDFDNKGEISAKGLVDNNLLNNLNELSFYKKKYPKSLGIEWVHESIFPLLDCQLIEINIMRTFVEHIAIQIGKVIDDFDKVLFTGGGVYNTFLLERIKVHCNTQIIVPNNLIINYKEALIFALLGLLKLQNRVNCLASVTGAKENHSSGRIFHPNNSL